MGRKGEGREGQYPPPFPIISIDVIAPFLPFPEPPEPIPQYYQCVALLLDNVGEMTHSSDR